MNIGRYWLWLLVAVALFASGGLAERLPLQKKPIDFKLPAHYEKSYGPPDPGTGISREYDPQLRLIPLGKNPGRYAFEWITFDGKKKRVIYERPDGTDAIVAARVSEASDGYQYTYRVEVLPSSGVRLGAFMVRRSPPFQRRSPGSLHGSMFLRPGYTDKANRYTCGPNVEQDPAVQRRRMDTFCHSRKFRSQRQSRRNGYTESQRRQPAGLGRMSYSWRLAGHEGRPRHAI